MKKINKIFYLLLFIGTVAPFFDIADLDKQHSEKILIKQENADLLYQLIKDIHEIFEFFKIEYWIQGGTLVGALRHGGLIAWDDDADINVSYKELWRILELKPLFEMLGYYVKFRHTLVIKIGVKRKCLVDIFAIKNSENKITYLRHWWKRGNKPLYLYENELYPLKLYQFGPLQLWGPHDPFTYLRCGFGDNYMSNIRIYNHKMKIKHDCLFEDIAPEFQSHVKPSAPLKDRLADINLHDFAPQEYGFEDI